MTSVVDPDPVGNSPNEIPYPLDYVWAWRGNTLRSAPPSWDMSEHWRGNSPFEQCCGAGPFLTGSSSRGFFGQLRLLWKSTYALKKLKKMNNSTSCSRKNTFCVLCALFVKTFPIKKMCRSCTKIGSRLCFSLSEIKINFKKVKLHLQYQYLQIVSSVNFWGTFLKFNF